MTKINQLVGNWPKGTVKTVKELREHGYTPQLLKVYSNSKWIESVVGGMYKLYHDDINWQGVLYGLQKKNNASIHAGGKTALILKGYGHYLSSIEGRAYLFSDRKENFNVWLSKFKNVVLRRNEVFDYKEEKYFIMFNTGNFQIKISSPELAAMEMLYLVPQEQSFDEAAKITEGLATLRPAIIQDLLQNCNSVKVKRLFLFMAENYDHPWMKELNLENINLGSGKRSIVNDGVLNKKYNLTVPREYAK